MFSATAKNYSWDSYHFIYFQGKRLENFDGPLEIDRQPETEDETSKTNNSSDDSAWD